MVRGRGGPIVERIAKLLLTVRLDPADASVEALREKYGLDPAGIDDGFGVVAIDPEHHQYAVMVDEVAAGKLGQAPGTQGPFANPRIEPFGPPEPETG